LTRFIKITKIQVIQGHYSGWTRTIVNVNGFRQMWAGVQPYTQKVRRELGTNAHSSVRHDNTSAITVRGDGVGTIKKIPHYEFVYLYQIKFLWVFVVQICTTLDIHSISLGTIYLFWSYCKTNNFRVLKFILIVKFIISSTRWNFQNILTCFELFKDIFSFQFFRFFILNVNKMLGQKAWKFNTKLLIYCCNGS